MGKGLMKFGGILCKSETSLICLAYFNTNPLLALSYVPDGTDTTPSIRSKIQKKTDTETENTNTTTYFYSRAMVTTMKLPLSSQCIKYLLFLFNLLFVITGIILLTIGLIIHGIFHNYQHFLDNKFFSVQYLLIAVGTIIFIIAFFGCCGAVRESYCMIVTFTSLLVLVFILELSAGISGYVLKSQASNIIQNKMITTMGEYNSTSPNEITYVWDTLQRDFDCCGTNNVTDWKKIYESGDLPMSCCDSLTGAVGTMNCTLNSENLHKSGCFPTFVSFIKGHAVQLGGAGIGIAFIQAIGICFSIHLARSIKNGYESV
ncbi:hypothetical protein KM043_009737 [Ampulex compressa]|nr:hypothetical protein KM043_009737 [Ampulex compressa]